MCSNEYVVLVMFVLANNSIQILIDTPSWYQTECGGCWLPRVGIYVLMRWHKQQQCNAAQRAEAALVDDRSVVLGRKIRWAESLNFKNSKPTAAKRTLTLKSINSNALAGMSIHSLRVLRRQQVDTRRYAHAITR